MYSYTLILKDKYSNKYIFISHILAGNDKIIKRYGIKTKQPLSGDMYGNITSFVWQYHFALRASVILPPPQT